MLRGLRLTDAVPLEHAEAIVARLAAAEAQLGTLDRLESGRPRLGSAGTVSAALLASAMAEFRRRWPSVELSLHELETDDPSAPVKGGKLDLAIAFESGIAPRALDPELDTVRLPRCPAAAGAPRVASAPGPRLAPTCATWPTDVDPAAAEGPLGRARRLRRGGRFEPRCTSTAVRRRWCLSSSLLVSGVAFVSSPVGCGAQRPGAVPR